MNDAANDPVEPAGGPEYPGPGHAGPEQIAEAAARLRAGGVVAFPTETVYGLGADAFDAQAVERVFRLKGRPANNPLIVHVADADMARRVAREWPAPAEALASAFWPGPLTIVLPRASTVPEIVTAGGPTVALRCPDHHLTLALISAFGPIVGPSANPSGTVSPTTAEHVRAAFGPEDVLVLDGGPCRGGIESTVVALDARGGAAVLRPGLIGSTEIARVLGRPVKAPAPVGAASDAASAAALPSPGMMPRHYAPRTPTIAFEAADWPRALGRATGPVAVVTHRQREVPPPHQLVAMSAGARDYAAELYATLRRTDGLGLAMILIELPTHEATAIGPDAEVWRAIMDRLRRATHP